MPINGSKKDKFLFFTDIHIHPHSNDCSRMEDGFLVLDWVLNLCIQNDITDCFFLGDMFHNRENQKTVVVTKVAELLRKFGEHNIILHMLPGNHDMPYKRSTENNILEIFKSNKINVYSEPHVVYNDEYAFFLIPYIEDASTLRRVVRDVEEKRKRFGDRICILLMHVDIVGAKHTAQNISSHGLCNNDFSKWDMIMSGHYHIKQIPFNGMLYLGSPLEHDFSDFNSGDRGVWILGPNLDLSFVKNSFSPKFLYLTEDQISEAVDGNFVCVKVDYTKKNSMDAIKELGSSFGAKNVRVMCNVDDRSSTSADDNIKSFFDLKKTFTDWVEKRCPPSCDKNHMIQIGFNLIEE